MRKQPPIKPVVTEQQFLRRHVLRFENDMRGVVFYPITMQQTSLGFHLPEKRRAGIWCQYVKCGALHPAGLDPLHQGCKCVLAVAIEPRSEEHTSELQSLRHLVCRLLLEKKTKNMHRTNPG